MHSMLGMRQLTCKAWLPFWRKQLPERLSQSLSAVWGKGQPGTLVKTVVSSCGKENGSLLMNKLDFVWGSIFQLPSQQEGGSSSGQVQLAAALHPAEAVEMDLWHGNKLPFLYRWTAGYALNKGKDILYCHLKYLSVCFTGLVVPALKTAYMTAWEFHMHWGQFINPAPAETVVFKLILQNYPKLCLNPKKANFYLRRYLRIWLLINLKPSS